MAESFGFCKSGSIRSTNKIHATNVTVIDFRSLSPGILWICHTWLDICSTFCKSGKIFKESFGSQSIKEMNKIVQDLKET